MTTQYKDLVKELSEKKCILVTVESCTGGLIAKTITDLPGSSTIFDRGFITYSNQSKQDMVNVESKVLDTFGAVSEQTAKQMAEGAIKNSIATISLSVTGIAGPGGGTTEKPVGMVCFGWVKENEEAQTETIYFAGDRLSIRQQAVDHALKGVRKIMG